MTNQSNSGKQAGKETLLANAETHTFKEKCGNCGKFGHKRTQYLKPKGGGERGGGGHRFGGCNNRGGRGNGGSNTTCNHCGIKGHLEAGY